jgi:hypothetical protein
MKAFLVSVVRRLRSAGSVGYFLLTMVTLSSAQTALIDFTFTDSVGTGSGFPWREDGFTVNGLATSSFFQPPRTISNPWVGAVSIGSPPYDGALSFLSGVKPASVIITNDSARLFDFLSVDVDMLDFIPLAATNYAWIISSAGGLYDLSNTLVGTTLSFGGHQWENLSYLIIEFQSSGGNAPPGLGNGLQLDNFLLRPAVVPEPSGLLVLSVVFLGVFTKKSKSPR